jgi:cell division protein FtsB
MRIVVAVITTLLLLIQWPLWFGKGGWLRVSELERQLAAQK